MESLADIEAILDEDPIDVEAFKEGAVVLTSEQAWGRLESYYLRQLRRVNDLDEPEIKFHLWHQLGQIYELRLDELEKADQAYQVALSIQPDNSNLKARLMSIQEKLDAQ